MNSLQVNILFLLLITAYTNIVLLVSCINNELLRILLYIYLFCHLCLILIVLVQFPYNIDLDIRTHMFYFYSIYFL